MKHLQTSLPSMISAVQLAESGSFTSAAKALNRTPAAVSKSIASLEASLQVRLFNRNTRRVSLTEEGKVFITQARDGLNLLEAASVSATTGLKTQGLVRISSSAGFGRRFVLPILPSFYALYPLVQVGLSLDDYNVDLVHQGFDMGIRGGSQPPEGMVARKICNFSAVLVCTPRYLKARGTPKHYSDLAQHDLLRVKFAAGTMTPWLFKEGGKVVNFEGSVKLHISEHEVVLDAALLHMGIARMGRHHAHEALQRGDLVEVLPHHHVPGEASMNIFYPHRAGLASRVRVLVDFLLDQFAKNPALQCG